MKKTLQEERQRMVNIMSQIDKTFVLKEGRYSGYERLDPPDDYWGDDEGQGEPETPSVNTEDFKLHGGIENPGNYLYTVYETKPNSEFGDVLMQAAKYADDNSSWSIEFMKTHPDARETEYKRNNKGIYGHDFSDEDIPRIKEVLNKHINVKGIPEFIKAMDEVSGEMKEYEENRDRYESRGSNDNFNEPDDDRDYNSGDQKNAWMDYINEDKKMSKLLGEQIENSDDAKLKSMKSNALSIRHAWGKPKWEDEPDDKSNNKEDVHIILGRMQSKLERCHQNLERLSEYLNKNPGIHEIKGFVKGILRDFE